MGSKQTSVVILVIGSVLCVASHLLGISLNIPILSTLAVLMSVFLMRHFMRPARKLVIVPLKTKSFYSRKIYLS